MPSRTAIRRKLDLKTLEDCRTEVQRIIAAEAAGTLKATGNWTAGEILTHLAAWIQYGYEGYPMRKLPFFVQWILKRKLRDIFREGMQPGVRIPGIKAGTTGMEDIETSVAASRLLAAIDRLEADRNPPHDSPAFGKMSHEDRILLNLRHAELHLSYLSY